MTDSINARLDALNTVHERFPNASHDEQMRIAEWMVSGSTLLDPVRVDQAARALAAMSGQNFENRDVAAEMRGRTQQVITAYHATPEGS